MLRGIAPTQAEYVADIELGQWMRAYRHTHADGKRIDWPDGGTYADQLNLTVELWELIEDEIAMRDRSNKK
jgi:hypothetical protein